MNTALCRSGHFWQNRFFSCALDEPHTWAAVRLGLDAAPVNLDLSWRSERFTPEEWRVLLASDSLSEAEDRLRANTYTGRPAGEKDFVQQAELALKRTLQRRKGGRPRKNVDGSSGQVTLFTEGSR